MVNRLFTFQNLTQLVDVIVRASVVDDGIDREQEFGLDLREAVQHTLETMAKIWEADTRKEKKRGVRHHQL